MHHLDLSDSPTTHPTPKSPIDEASQSGDNAVSLQPRLHTVDTTTHHSMTNQTRNTLITFGLLAVLTGIGTGFGSYKLYAQRGGGTSQEVVAQPVAGGNIKNGDVFGSSNTDTFKDTATGYLEAGGLDGEGSHKLLRPGGETQTVYLTSSVTDLDKLVGMEVKVWGETYAGQKAGWLMDVGRIEVVNTKGEAPTQE